MVQAEVVEGLLALRNSSGTSSWGEVRSRADGDTFGKMGVAALLAWMGASRLG